VHLRISSRGLLLLVGNSGSVRFTSNWSRPGCVRGCCRIKLATRLRVLYKQIYSPLHGPRGRTPRLWKTTPHHPAPRKAIAFTLSIIAIIAATDFLACCTSSISNHCHAWCSSVAATIRRLMSAPSSYRVSQAATNPTVASAEPQLLHETKPIRQF